MAISFLPDPDAPDDIPGVDRHFYENQVPPSTTWSDTSFKQAAAAAKDRARYELIKAVQQANLERLTDAGRLEELGSFISGEQVQWTRSIDGVEGAPDNDIKL